MRIVFRCVMLSALAAFQATGLPANASDTKDEICVSKERLEIERFFRKHEKPILPEGACSDDLSAYRVFDAALTVCLHGYARHSNGRCYKIVDKPQDGGAVKKHEYRVTFRGDCKWLTSEVLATDLKADYTLDFCDEDGGCAHLLDGDEEGRSVFPVQICAKGYAKSDDGRCVKIFEGSSKYESNPKNQGGYTSDGRKIAPLAILKIVLGICIAAF